MTTHEVQAIDLEMQVRTQFDQGRTRLTFNLHSPTGAVAFAHREITGPDFQGSSEELQARLWKKIERLSRLEDVDGTKLSISERDHKLESLGQDLWRDLLPQEIRSAYRRIRRSVRTWTIVSDEPWIPWELIKPYDANDPEDILNDDFLALQFELTRWLAGDKIPAFQVVVENWAAIDASHNLPLAFSERDFLAEIAAAYPDMTDVTPQALSTTEVLEFLREGAADLIHFAGHGVQIAGQPEEAGLQLKDGSVLRPTDLSGEVATRIGQERPLIFFNACWAGRQGRALTRLGGWATRLVSICGCGAFVAPMWLVRDSTAANFARVFYRNIREGATLGAAVLAARQEGFQASRRDPSALAYAVYGSPSARILFGRCSSRPREGVYSERFENAQGTSRVLAHRRERDLTCPPNSRTWVAGLLVAALAATVLWGMVGLWCSSSQKSSINSGTSSNRSISGIGMAPEPVEMQGAVPKTGLSENVVKTRRPTPWPTGLEQPFEAFLQDGQQLVILGGRASVAAEFSRVGEVEVPTVHLWTDGAEQLNYALLNAGMRIEFKSGGNHYVASVLDVDEVDRLIHIKINRLK